MRDRSPANPVHHSLKVKSFLLGHFPSDRFEFVEVVFQMPNRPRIGVNDSSRAFSSTNPNGP
jgi:hypothetical protein